jgi:hypothetical protein
VTILAVSTPAEIRSIRNSANTGQGLSGGTLRHLKVRAVLVGKKAVEDMIALVRAGDTDCARYMFQVKTLYTGIVWFSSRLGSSGRGLRPQTYTGSPPYLLNLQDVKQRVLGAFWRLDAALREGFLTACGPSNDSKWVGHCHRSLIGGSRIKASQITFWATASASWLRSLFHYSQASLLTFLPPSLHRLV